MRRLGGAAGAAVLLVLLTGCSGPTAGTPSSTATVTATVAAPSSSAPSSSTPATPSASASASSTPAPSASSTASTAADADRPAGQCPDDALGVSVVAAQGGAAAGSVYYQVLFTNTSGDSCVLRGTPGVSVVGKGNGTQLGPPADRVQTGVKDVRLGVGQTVAAQLRIVDIGTNGGPLPHCSVVHGNGYRVYPPHSTRAFFVQDAKAVACASGPVFMTVSPVVRFTE